MNLGRSPPCNEKRPSALQMANRVILIQLSVPCKTSLVHKFMSRPLGNVAEQRDWRSLHLVATCVGKVCRLKTRRRIGTMVTELPSGTAADTSHPASLSPPDLTHRKGKLTKCPVVFSSLYWLNLMSLTAKVQLKWGWNRFKTQHDRRYFSRVGPKV